MKEIKVKSSKLSETILIIQINNYDNRDVLTPALARKAISIAGCGCPATVWDRHRAYRITSNSARRCSAEEEIGLCDA